jgi:hypothetical protein
LTKLLYKELSRQITLSLNKALVPVATSPSKRQAVDEITQSASPQRVCIAVLQRDDAVVDQDSHELFSFRPTTRHLLKVSAGCKRDRPARAVAGRLGRGLNRGVGERRRGVVQANSAEDVGQVAVGQLLVICVSWFA